VFRRSGGWVAKTAGEFAALDDDPTILLEARPGWTDGLTFGGFLARAPKAGVLVECTPSNWRTGEPQLAYFHSALDRGWSIAAASKGALVVDFKNLRSKARAAKLALKFSGATAAALPTLDVATISLAGAKIHGFEGILETALLEAQDKGIAEPDPSMDIDGWDTACKLLLIANAAAGTEFTIDDIRVEGIRGVTAEAIHAARVEGQALKLFGRLYEIDGCYAADVKPVAVPPSHPLYRLTGTSKGIVFRTDTMGTVAVTDGKSDPRGTAAAVLKDVINIYRDR
jgi:homoserine dehydrogenase